jgi:hypothetical protein
LWRAESQTQRLGSGFCDSPDDCRPAEFDPGDFFRRGDADADRDDQGAAWRADAGSSPDDARDACRALHASDHDAGNGDARHDAGDDWSGHDRPGRCYDWDDRGLDGRRFDGSACGAESRDNDHTGYDGNGAAGRRETRGCDAARRAASAGRP